MRIQLLITVLVFNISCSPNQSESKNQASSAETEIADNKSGLTTGNAFSKAELYEQKALIDTLFNRSENGIKVLNKVAGNSNLIEIRSENWPDNIETTFNVLKNDKGRILKISEGPYSESGDWDIIYSHYFDEAGNTFAFEKRVTAFNAFCPNDPTFNGITVEKTVKLFSPEFVLIDDIYKMVDEKDQNITAKECQQEVSSKSPIYKNLDNYSKPMNYNFIDN